MSNKFPQSARERYETDHAYREVVDLMQYCITQHGLTPSEMREAAILASINYESMNIRRFHIPLTRDLHERLIEWDEIVSKAPRDEP